MYLYDCYVLMHVCLLSSRRKEIKPLGPGYAHLKKVTPTRLSVSWVFVCFIIFRKSSQVRAPYFNQSRTVQQNIYNAKTNRLGEQIIQDLWRESFIM